MMATGLYAINFQLFGSVTRVQISAGAPCDLRFVLRVLQAYALEMNKLIFY